MNMAGGKGRDAAGGGDNWLKITVLAPPHMAEAVSDLLGVLSGAGVELRPGQQRGVPISAFFHLAGDGDEASQRIKELEKRLGELFDLYGLTAPVLEKEYFADQDWATSWQEYFHAFAVIPGLIIRPSWEPYQAEEGERVIVMDPGQAFGTGQHASTSMALELVRDSLREMGGGRVLDVGCGTGILAMAAALFGADSVLAIDNDPEAVRVASENIAINQLEQRIRVSGRDLQEIEGTFDLICANIVHNVLVDMAPELTARLVPGGRLVLAGILSGEQEENIIRVYRVLGCSPVARRHTDEWTGLLVRKSG